MFELLFMGATMIAIIGTILNSFKLRVGFVLWIISNIILLYQASYLQVNNLIVLYFIYLILAIWGLFYWKKEGSPND